VRSLLRIARAALVSAAAIAAVMAVGAASASALPTWSTTGGVVAEGDVTLRLNGGSPTVCEDFSTAFAAQNVSGQARLYPAGNPWIPENGCGVGKYFSWYPLGAATGSGPYTMGFQGLVAGLTSPFGAYTSAVPYSVPFQNAAGGLPSRMTFNSTVIGQTSGGSLSMTGTLDLTLLAGGNITLN